jgi:hypothetical protein
MWINNFKLFLMRRKVQSIRRLKILKQFKNLVTVLGNCKKNFFYIQKYEIKLPPCGPYNAENADQTPLVISIPRDLIGNSLSATILRMVRSSATPTIPRSQNSEFAS